MTEHINKLSELPPPPHDPIRDALLGCDLEMDEATAERILDSHGLNAEMIVDEFKTRLQRRIRENNESGGKEAENENLLHFVRDITNYKKARSPDAVEPKSWIQSIIENTNQILYPAMGNAYAYRGNTDGDLSEHDQKLIDQLEAELNDEPEN